MKDKILELRSQGKSYKQIKKDLGCSSGTIAYHCGNGQKEKNRIRNIKSKKRHPYVAKMYNFKSEKPTIVKPKDKRKLRRTFTDKVYDFRKRGKNMNEEFTIEDVINKFGEKPKCYITGQQIDIYQPKTYNFDHIIPVSRGGTSSLDNLGICTKRANLAKGDMTPQELLEFCKQVLINNNYSIEAEGENPAISIPN